MLVGSTEDPDSPITDDVCELVIDETEGLYDGGPPAENDDVSDPLLTDAEGEDWLDGKLEAGIDEEETKEERPDVTLEAEEDGDTETEREDELIDTLPDKVDDMADEAVPMHEQADEIADGESLHFAAYAGSPVVAVLIVVVYVAQKLAAKADDLMSCRRQLFRLHFRGGMALVSDGEAPVL